jgi:hypothetical protein
MLHYESAMHFTFHLFLIDSRPHRRQFLPFQSIQEPACNFGFMSYSRVCYVLYIQYVLKNDRLCGLVVRVLGYRSGGPGSIPGTTKKK